ncbi:MAG TPA: ATP-binding protein, partial [Candidatus Portnoybacteria bacterium]|nr:ATP-binding protein [Candidatus Portnoybacteria bacterium]
MKIVSRTTYLDLWKELSSEKRMILLAGPRQTGKTTLVKEIAKNYKNSLYFNWDIIADKKKIIENPTFFEEINRVDNSDPLVIFDEIHKYKNWKNYLKGIYDEFFRDYFFLVSGSGRLDIYQKGGDSLAGRYLMFHLFPFTLSELAKNKRKFTEFIKNPLTGFDLNDEKLTEKIWHNLSELSGFPEPFLKNKKTFWRKWTQIYTHQVIYEDIQSLSDIRRIEQVNLLYSLLSGKIGSPLSINSLAEDLQVAFDTVKNWLSIFDIFYLTFQISPWSKRINRAITREKKIYLFNYPLIVDIAHRFENMAALELYR